MALLKRQIAVYKKLLKEEHYDPLEAFQWKLRFLADQLENPTDECFRPSVVPYCLRVMADVAEHTLQKKTPTSKGK